MMYMTLVMLRALAPDDMTAAQQREADEQLGKVAAALARSRHRLAGRVRTAATTRTPPGRLTAALAGVGGGRRSLEGARMPAAARGAGRAGSDRRAACGAGKEG
jgi:hypothetical protein